MAAPTQLSAVENRGKGIATRSGGRRLRTPGTEPQSRFPQHLAKRRHSMPLPETRYELAVLEGINARLIYDAVELDLVEVERESNRKTGGYRFHLSDRGRKLLDITD